jgi:hypothetical protein
MPDLSRREFIRKGSVGAAAGIAAATLVADGGIANAVVRSAGKATDVPASERNEEPIVAVVKRGSRGEVTLMAGSTEVVRKDADLARRIVRASKTR